MQPNKAEKWKEEERKRKGTIALPLVCPACWPAGLPCCAPSPNLRRAPPGVLLPYKDSFLFVLYSFCQFTPLSTGRCSFVLLYLLLLSLSVQASSCRSLFFPPFSSSSPEHGINWRGGWPFPPCLSGAPTPTHAHPLVIPGSRMPVTPALCHSILLLCISLPSAWCQVWGLCSVPKCLQSTELQTSFPSALLFNWTIMVRFFKLLFLRILFLLLSFFLNFQELYQTISALSPPPPASLH